MGRILTIIVILLAAFFILSYFGISLRKIAESDTGKDNQQYVHETAGVAAVSVWEKISGPVMYLWNDVFVDLLWSSFIENMKRIKAGVPTTLEQAAPTVN